MLKISKLTDYAVILLGSMQMGERYAASSLAERTLIPEPTVAKILKLLAGQNFLLSHRGVSGGYELARPLDGITILDLTDAIDGPVTMTACVDGAHHSCAAENICGLRGRWDSLNADIKGVLNNYTVAQMAMPRPVFLSLATGKK